VLGHFWTLAVEEQFYLVWPWVVWSVPPKHLPRICLIGAASALLLRIVLVSHFGPVFWIRNLTLTRADTVLTGSALAASIHAGKHITKQALLTIVALGLSVLAVVALHNYRELREDKGALMSTIGYTGVALVCCSALASALTRAPIATKFLQTPRLRQLGKYSYGLYVFHAPVNFCISELLHPLGIKAPLPIAPASLVIMVQTSLACAIAYLSYTFFENSFLARKQNFQAHFTNSVNAAPALSSSTIPP
jgi:peptidoglycan/LPS O-acetylase OafA/YrhL